MAKIFKDGIIVDDQSGKIYAVGNPDNLLADTTGKNTFNTYREAIDAEAASNKPVVTYNPDGTRSLSAADKYWQDNPVQSNSDFNTQQNTTKAEFAKRQQDAIDSINNMYVSILAKANQTGQDKLGSANVINALSGNRGSASGAAVIDKTNQANDEIMKGIEAEKQNKISTIMNNTFKDQTEELRYQNELRRQNLDKYLAYMGTKETENLTKSKAMRAELISNNIGINDITPDTLKQMADNAGYTVDQFKVLYESERKAKEKEFLNNEQKRLADLEKTKAETAKITSEANKDPLMAKGYIPLAGTNDLNGLTENDIIRVGDKIYRKPANTKAPVTKTIGKDLFQYNDKTGGWDKVVSAPKSSTVKPKITYDDKTIPVDLKKEILQNINAGAKKEDVLINYPEVNSKYIDTLYPKNGRQL